MQARKLFGLDATKPAGGYEPPQARGGEDEQGLIEGPPLTLDLQIFKLNPEILDKFLFRGHP